MRHNSNCLTATLNQSNNNNNNNNNSLYESNDFYNSNSNPDYEMWKQIQLMIKENLNQYDSARKFCAYCGLKENSNSEDDDNKNKFILGRCYGCQMVYYCNQEHQHLDWLENHMPKCAELEWVALGELIQSIPINLPLTNLSMTWPDGCLVNTWTDWFDIRPDLVNSIHEIAKTLENKLFSSKNQVMSKFNRREPTYNDLVDGLLATITDTMTFALTIGDAIAKIGINPSAKPICIHLLHPSKELINDLVYILNSQPNDFNAQNIDKTEIENSVKRKFYELCNMFPYNKGFEIVLISTNTILDLNSQMVMDYTHLLQPPFMKTQLQNCLPLNNKNLYISAWQGTYTNYIRYACQIEGYSQPDLVVSFQPNFTTSPHKLIMDWTDDLKIILTNNFPCLFTFSDKDERQKAYNVLNAFQTNFISVQSNQFSSLMLKQIATKPNHVISTNSFYMIIKGFTGIELETRHLKCNVEHQLQHNSVTGN